MLTPYVNSPADNLGLPERYFIRILDIPQLQIRLESWYFQRSFERKFDYVEESVDGVLAAISELRGSASFRRILQIVLAYGNYLNGNTPRGGAFGFHIEALLRLADVRSLVDQNTTGLHYIVEIVHSHFKDDINLAADLPTVSLASKVNLSVLGADIKALEAGVFKCEQVLKSPLSSSKDGASRVFGAFTPAAKKRVEEAKSKLTKATDQVKKLISYFGEASSLESDDFFAQIDRFIAMFNKAKLDNQKRRLLEEKAKQALEKAREAEQSKAAAVPKKGPASKAGFMDQVLGQLVSGEAFTRAAARMRSNSQLKVRSGSPRGENDSPASSSKRFGISPGRGRGGARGGRGGGNPRSPRHTRSPSDTYDSDDSTSMSSDDEMSTEGSDRSISKS